MANIKKNFFLIEIDKIFIYRKKQVLFDNYVAL